jgi:Ricin-type beta-trefoil lectin domain
MELVIQVFGRRSRGLMIGALIPIIIALGAVSVVPATAAAPQSVALGHLPGGNGETAHLYTPAHPVKMGKIAYDAVNGAPVSGTLFAVGSSAANCVAPDVCYNGGHVQANPRVYLVFWGPWWFCTGAGCVNCPTSTIGCGDSNSLQVEKYLWDYWHQVGQRGEAHATVTSQYQDSFGVHPTFGRGVYGTRCSTDGFGNCGGVVWQEEPPASPTPEQIAQMASTAANYFGVQSNADAQIVVLTPQGNQPSGFGTAFCAWHSAASSDTGADLSFTLMPWLPDAAGLLQSCDARFGLFGTMDGWSEYGGHEFAESVTDPVPNNGYSTPLTPLPSDANNMEIGDRCNTQTFHETMPNGNTYSQEALWSDLDHGCVPYMPVGAVKGYIGKRIGNKCIDNAGGRRADGNKIEIWGCNHTAAQLLYNPSSSGHLVVNGSCLDVSGASRQSGAKVILYHCGKGDNQNWSYDTSTGQWEVYRGFLGFGAMCLDVPGFSTANGTQLIIYSCNSGANQRWTLPEW